MTVSIADMRPQETADNLDVELVATDGAAEMVAPLFATFPGTPQQESRPKQKLLPRFRMFGKK